MPWQVTDLEESSVKAIHQPVVFYGFSFSETKDPHCSNTPWLTTITTSLLLHFQVVLPGPAESWFAFSQFSMSHNSSQCNHHIPHNIFQFLHDVSTTGFKQCHGDLTHASVLLVKDIFSGHWEVEECLKQKTLFVPSVKLTANSGIHS